MAEVPSTGNLGWNLFESVSNAITLIGRAFVYLLALLALYLVWGYQLQRQRQMSRG